MAGRPVVLDDLGIFRSAIPFTGKTTVFLYNLFANSSQELQLSSHQIAATDVSHMIYAP